MERMELLLHAAAHALSTFLEAATLVLLAVGAMLAIKIIVWGALSGRDVNTLALDAWQGMSRWILVGLEFLLAADLVSTVVSPSWDELGRLATIAAIRTLIGFFLARDVEAARRIAHEQAEAARTRKEAA